MLPTPPKPPRATQHVAPEPLSTWHQSHSARGTRATLHVGSCFSHPRRRVAPEPLSTWHQSHSACGTKATHHVAPMPLSMWHRATWHVVLCFSHPRRRVAPMPLSMWHQSHSACGTEPHGMWARVFPIRVATWHQSHSACGTKATQHVAPKPLSMWHHGCSAGRQAHHHWHMARPPFARRPEARSLVSRLRRGGRLAAEGEGGSCDGHLLAPRCAQTGFSSRRRTYPHTSPAWRHQAAEASVPRKGPASSG